MFVSSYNTYIQTNASHKTEKQKIEKSESDSAFSAKLFEKPKLKLSSTSFPVDYISKGKSSKNQVEIQRQLFVLQNPENIEQKNQTKLKKAFTSQQKMKSAQTAYKDNSRLFSLLQKPQTKTIDQTPKVNVKLPENIQELKEENMRRVMVNAYIQNDKYYKITA